MKKYYRRAYVSQMARLLTLALTVILASGASQVSAGTLGTTDTFTSSLDNWQKGQVNPTYLSIIENGGPAGAGDSYLQSVADGSGSFGRLTIFNTSQWNSNYVTNGVTSIRMDLLNAGSVPLEIRLGLRDGSGAGYISTDAFALSAGSSWQTVEFMVTEAALTAVGSPGSLSTFLDGGFALRILHATGTSNLNGDSVVSTLGVDNITAVPEPSTVYLVGMSGILLFAVVRRLRLSRQS